MVLRVERALAQGTLAATRMVTATPKVPNRPTSLPVGAATLVVDRLDIRTLAANVSPGLAQGRNRQD